MSAVLTASGIWKAFGDKEVLRGISLELEANEVVALIGPSGSGKSTLLRCLNLLESVDDGQILLAIPSIRLTDWYTARLRQREQMGSIV